MGFSLKKILGGSGSNAYVAPDLSWLKDTSGFDFLKNPTAGYFSGDSESLFQDYIKNIQAPSSVDEVRTGIESEQLDNMLRDIQRGTNQSIGSAKLDYADRGLGGAGQLSDIEAVGLGQIRGQGEEIGANARLSAYQAQLDRLKARETAGREAYGIRYGAGVNADTQVRGINDGRTQLFANLLNNRDITRAGGQLKSAADYASSQVNTPGLFETMLRGFGNSYANSIGSKLGGK